METRTVLTIAEIRRQLRHIHTKEVADTVGLSLHTLYRIKRGQLTSPYFDTIVRLSDYFIAMHEELEEERQNDKDGSNL